MDRLSYSELGKDPTYTKIFLWEIHYKSTVPRNSVRVERRSDLGESDLGEVYCIYNDFLYKFTFINGNSPSTHTKGLSPDNTWVKNPSVLPLYITQVGFLCSSFLLSALSVPKFSIYTSFITSLKPDW